MHCFYLNKRQVSQQTFGHSTSAGVNNDVPGDHNNWTMSQHAQYLNPEINSAIRNSSLILFIKPVGFFL